MAATRLAGRSVLIVDDDDDVRGSIDLAFRGEGAATRTVADGTSAVLAVQQSRPDLVILDMMLPQRSGFLVLEKLREAESMPAVIMVTANQGRRHMAYAQGLGVDAYMVKPVSLHRLVETAVRLLGER
ncbi:MAG TPA: response regulator [Phycisphaerales bacterium]|nr:response regulator [Phycisphaerales bacterium]HMP37302.1 response regulator [Phycisphaerales bacterium]